MINDVKKTTESKMNKTLEAFKTDLSKVRTGRAHTGLLDHVMVDYYGSPTAINQVANVTLLDARTIAQAEARGDLLLENGDILRVPTKDGLVLISGEVLFPNAIAFDSTLSLDDYVRRAGGYTQNAETARLVVARRDGSFTEAGGDTGFFSLGNGNVAIRAGDEILVLPKIDVKSRQIWKDMTQIIYQIAVSAKVVFGL